MIARLSSLATGAGNARRVLIGAGVLFLLAAAFGAPVTTILKSSNSDFQNRESREPAGQKNDRTGDRAARRLRRGGARDERRERPDERGRPARGRPRRRDARRPAWISARARLSGHAPRGARLARRPPDRRAGRVLHAGRSATAVARLRPQLASQDVRFGGPDVAFSEINKRTSSDLKQRRAAGLPDPAAALVLGLPRPDRGGAAAARGRVRDRDHVPRPAPDQRGDHGPVDLRRQPRHRDGPRPGDRLQPVRALALPRGARAAAPTAAGDRPNAADRRAHSALQLR